MSRVRVLVGTRKGAFILTADGARDDWEVTGPLFGGWEIHHVAGSPVEPDRLWAAQSNGWFGQIVNRSDDGGVTWQVVGNDFEPASEPGTHQSHDGSSVPWAFNRVWHLRPSTRDVDTIHAGVEDAALFRSTDAGDSWSEVSGLREHESGSDWMPGAGGLCLHTILPHPDDEDRMLVAISAAGVFATRDGGETWVPSNRGLRSGFLPDPDPEVGHCVHKLARHPDRPEVVFMQKHWDVMRSDDEGRTWREISGDLPTDFGFAIDVHTHEPDTVYVVPIHSDEQHYPPEGGGGG